MVHLKPVDETNYEACSNLMCTKEQCAFTNSPGWALLQAAYESYKDRVKLMAIYDGKLVIGMIRLDYTESDCYMFTDLLIDKKYQGKGFAQSALAQVFDIFRADAKHSKIKIKVAENNHAAVHIYKKFGFSFIENNKDSLSIMECRLI
ncbi:MAG: GNAT family N-acetyltransferase [Oscillospiraceae bacterium]|nr:GNAT family N-acetyltransferase [Oscillospiraceae bacterium]